jgi:hypothetical protein
VEKQIAQLSKIGQCEACFAPTNESPGGRPLIEATRKVMPQRGEFQIFFPEKFGTRHVRAARQ